MKYFNDIIKEISKEDIIEYYINQNNYIEDCAKYFNISYGMFIRLLKYYEIKKDKKLSSELCKKTKLEKYGTSSYNNRLKAKSTCLQKYGFDNPFKDKNKIQNSYINKLGVIHPMKNEQIKKKVISKLNYDEIHKKGKITYKQITGFSNPMQNPDVKKKNLESRINSGTFDSPNTSGIERRLEKILIRKFGDIKTHYRDSRYSRNTGYLFECDFYIPSEDLFIELNAHPTHNNRPYRNTQEDLEEINSLKVSNKCWDKNLLETWAIRDVEKQNCAKNNNLNYIVLYPSNTITQNINFNKSEYKELITYLLKKLLKI